MVSWGVWAAGRWDVEAGFAGRESKVGDGMCLRWLENARREC